MHEIICTHCQKAFKIDESGYANIVKQIRNNEFDHELHERLELAEKDKHNAIELAKSHLTRDMEKEISKKNSEIQELKSILDASENIKKLAVTEAINNLERERDNLANELKQAKYDKETASQLSEARLDKELGKTIAEKDSEIQELKAKINNIEVTQRLAITQAVNAVEKERDGLNSSLEQIKLEKQLAEKSLIDKYKMQIEDRDKEIERLRDMKVRMSTKMVGETLEQHCENEFNRIRATAFSKAYFEKDNDVRFGSKGDYIFRDLDDTGNEIVSIMFEMKNENDETSSKS